MVHDYQRVHNMYSSKSLYKLLIKKTKVGIQTIKSNKKRGKISDSISVRKSLHYDNYSVQCQNRDFLIKLCCDIITDSSVVLLLFIAWIPTTFKKN